MKKQTQTEPTETIYRKKGRLKKVPLRRLSLPTCKGAQVSEKNIKGRFFC